MVISNISEERKGLVKFLTLSEDAPVKELVAGGERQNTSILAKNLLAKITTMRLKNKPREADQRVAGQQLGEVCELIIKKKFSSCRWQIGI